MQGIKDFNVTFNVHKSFVPRSWSEDRSNIPRGLAANRYVMQDLQAVTEDNYFDPQSLPIATDPYYASQTI